MRIAILFSFLLSCSSLIKAQDLAFYIEQAKINSALIQDNRNLSEAARLEAERLKAFYTKAQVSLTGAYMFAPIISRDNNKSDLVLNSAGTDTNYSGYDIAASNAGMYQGMINWAKPLFSNPRYEAAAGQVLIGAQINENTARLSAHDLEKFITDQYILCLTDYKQTEYLNDLTKIISDQKNVVSKLVESGIAKQSDLALLAIEQKTQQTALNTFRATYRRDLMDLRVLCGITDTTYQVLDDIDLQPREDIIQSGWVERYRLDSLNLQAAQKLFELKYKPVVSLYANTGLNAVYAPTIPNRFGMSAGLNFTMNLTDGKQRQITQKRTSVLMRSTGRYRDLFYKQNTVRKGRILTELKSLNERLILTEQQLQEYVKLLSFYKQELSRGQISVINYITTLKSMIISQRDFVLLQNNKQLLINLYNYWNW